MKTGPYWISLYSLSFLLFNCFVPDECRAPRLSRLQFFVCFAYFVVSSSRQMNVEIVNTGSD